MCLCVRGSQACYNARLAHRVQVMPRDILTVIRQDQEMEALLGEPTVLATALQRCYRRPDLPSLLLRDRNSGTQVAWPLCGSAWVFACRCWLNTLNWVNTRWQALPRRSGSDACVGGGTIP